MPRKLLSWYSQRMTTRLKLRQPSEEALDFPAAAVAPQGSTALRPGLSAVALMRGNQLNPIILFQGFIQRIAVIGQVAYRLFRRVRGKAALDGRCHQPGFMWRSAGHVHGDRKTIPVCDCHDLAPFPALCFT